LANKYADDDDGASWLTSSPDTLTPLLA